MNRPTALTAIVVVLTMLAASHAAPARASDEYSFRKTHYLFEPAALLPGQSLRICAAHAEKAAMRKQSLYFAEVRLYGIDGTPLIELVAKSLEPDALGLCFDVETSRLGPPGSAPPDAVLAEVVLSAHASNNGFGFVTMETHDATQILTAAPPGLDHPVPVATGRNTRFCCRPSTRRGVFTPGGPMNRAFGVAWRIPPSRQPLPARWPDTRGWPAWPFSC